MFGGLQFHWLAEGDAIPGSFPRFGLADQKLMRAATIVRVTEELIADSVLLEGMLMEILPLAFAGKFENSIVRGVGGGVPIGIAKSPARITVAKEAGQPAATVLWENVRKMWSRLWTASKGERSLETTVWLADATVDNALLSMSQAVGTAGIPVYLPAGAAGNPYPTLMGRPILPVEYCEVPRGGGRPRALRSFTVPRGPTGDEEGPLDAARGLVVEARGSLPVRLQGFRNARVGLPGDSRERRRHSVAVHHPGNAELMEGGSLGSSVTFGVVLASEDFAGSPLLSPGFRRSSPSASLQAC